MGVACWRVAADPTGPKGSSSRSNMLRENATATTKAAGRKTSWRDRKWKRGERTRKWVRPGRSQACRFCRFCLFSPLVPRFSFFQRCSQPARVHNTSHATFVGANIRAVGGGLKRETRRNEGGQLFYSRGGGGPRAALFPFLFFSCRPTVPASFHYYFYPFHARSRLCSVFRHPVV